MISYYNEIQFWWIIYCNCFTCDLHCFFSCLFCFVSVCVYQFCVQDESLAYGNKSPFIQQNKTLRNSLIFLSSASQEMDAAVITKFALPRPHLMGRKGVEWSPAPGLDTSSKLSKINIYLPKPIPLAPSYVSEMCLHINRVHTALIYLTILEISSQKPTHLWFHVLSWQWLNCG